MHETAARQVLFVRAVEGAAAAGELLSEEDRRYAGRAAAELVRWQAADRGERASAEAFVVKRAELLAGKVAERWPRAGRALAAMRWRPWIGLALPAAAFAAGLLAEHISNPGRINVLAFPLLGIIVWNIAVYVWLAVRALGSLTARTRRRPGWLAELVAGARRSLGALAFGPLADVAGSFALDWGERSAPLVGARAARILHLAAALFALGAVAGLFLRGLVFEYRAGWESTFLDAGSVHAVLAFFLGPAARIIGESFPGVQEIAALRWDGSAGTGENAGRWIVLYAVTVFGVVIVPRLLLAALAGWRERRLACRFPLSLDEAYFRRVLSGWRESPACIEVRPYAYTPGEPALHGVRRLGATLFGDSVEMRILAPVGFGEEDAPLEANPHDAQAAPDLVIALFNLGSTPETENHGAFLDALRARTPGTLAVLVDEGPMRQRLGTLPEAQARIDERRDAWSGLAQTRGLQAVFADLGSRELEAAQRELDVQLTGRVVPA